MLRRSFILLLFLLSLLGILMEEVNAKEKTGKRRNPSKEQTVAPSTKTAPPTKNEKEKEMVVVDGDFRGPIMRAVQQVLASGGRNGQKRNGRDGRRQKSPAQRYYKPFLRALKRDDRHELKEIVRSNITKAQIAERVEKWVQESDDPRAKEAFDLFKQERELIKKLKLIGEENFLEDKSEEAKQLYYELKKIKEDQSLTWDQTCTKRNEVLVKADRELIDELRHKAKPCYRNDSYEKLTGTNSANKAKH